MCPFVLRHTLGHSHGGVLLVEAVSPQGAGGPGGQNVEEDVHLRTQQHRRLAPAGQERLGRGVWAGVWGSSRIQRSKQSGQAYTTLGDRVNVSVCVGRKERDGNEI